MVTVIQIRSLKNIVVEYTIIKKKRGCPKVEQPRFLCFTHDLLQIAEILIPPSLVRIDQSIGRRIVA